MALTAKSLFLYGLEVTPNNNAFDFRVISSETIRQATIPLGFYTLDGLVNQVISAMKAVASTYTFNYTIDRTFSSGTQNRVTISTPGSFLEFDFLSGPRTASSICLLLGYTKTDKTGAVTYTGQSTAGTALVSEWNGYNYMGPEFRRKNLGVVNVSASGIKEAITFSVQEFIQVEFKHEPQAKVVVEWKPMIDWIIQQKPFEFTPEITSPTIYYPVTLESTPGDARGLGMTFVEELPDKPFLFNTGMFVFRKVLA